jgi:hypothetical protein
VNSLLPAPCLLQIMLLTLLRGRRLFTALPIEAMPPLKMVNCLCSALRARYKVVCKRVYNSPIIADLAEPVPLYLRSSFALPIATPWSQTHDL